MNILDALADRTARPRVCETALIAHSLLAGPPACPITLSAPAALVMDIVTAHSGAARVALVSVVNIGVQWEPAAVQADALALAADAAALTVEELASIGTMRQVLDLLSSERFKARAPRVPSKQAA